VDTRVEKLLAPGLQREHERRLDAEEGGFDSNPDESSEDDAGDGDDAPAFEQSLEDWFAGLAEVERRAMERDVDVEYDAIVLAKAGLERAGLAHHVPFQPLPVEEFVPAPGQGALAVTAVDEDVADDVHDIIDHPPTRVATSVERIVLDELGGGCVAPIGVHAVVQGAVVHTVVRVLSRDGTEEVAATRDLPVERHPSAAGEFAADLREEGAATLIEAARREDPDAAKREE
jgi:hydroxymethylbilane synthase